MFAHAAREPEAVRASHDGGCPALVYAAISLAIFFSNSAAATRRLERPRVHRERPRVRRERRASAAVAFTRAAATPGSSRIAWRGAARRTLSHLDELLALLAAQLVNGLLGELPMNDADA